MHPNRVDFFLVRLCGKCAGEIRLVFGDDIRQTLEIPTVSEKFRIFVIERCEKSNHIL